MTCCSYCLPIGSHSQRLSTSSHSWKPLAYRPTTTSRFLPQPLALNTSACLSTYADGSSLLLLLSWLSCRAKYVLYSPLLQATAAGFLSCSLHRLWGLLLACRRPCPLAGSIASLFMMRLALLPLGRPPRWCGCQTWRIEGYVISGCACAWGIVSLIGTLRPHRSCCSLMQVSLGMKRTFLESHRTPLSPGIGSPNLLSIT